MNSKIRNTKLACFGMLAPCLAWSGFSAANDRVKLTTACEVAVARSAAPSRLRDDATVYALVDEDYRRVVDGDGPLTCIVERNHKDSIVPQCMDRAGAKSILPAIIARSRMALSGASFAEIGSKHTARLESGDYEAAERPGISYMMSDYTYTFVESANQVLKIPPHVMFYAPHLTNEDIGGSFQGMIENIGTPFVFDQGLHGYMIVYTQYEADPNEVAEQCRGQLGNPPPLFNPFSKG